MEDSSRQEETIQACLNQNNTEGAVKLLFDMIVESAKRKDFDRAEALRARLLEIDSLALTEIIQSAEVIEEEKRRAIDEKHIAIWSGLYRDLSPEEGNALYFSLKNEVCEATQTVFKQGQQHSRLYFVNRGQLALIWRNGRREAVLRKIGPGQVVAADGFFSESVCTISLVALTQADLAYLDKEVLVKWESAAPALEGKLRDFSRRSEDVTLLLKEQGIERRIYHRVMVSGATAVQLMSGSGTPVAKPFRGDIADISIGGASFFANIRDRKTARALLGRNVVLSLAIPGKDPQMKFNKKGYIVAVNHVPYEGFCLHVRFDEILTPMETEELHHLPVRRPTSG
jgi:hypothetical protein